MVNVAKRQLLARFVRQARERLAPLGGAGRRRTPGWRREEVAQHCGISLSWYTWIEQARPTAVSATVWSKLAQVLQLSPVERAYLFDLAGVADPEPAPPGRLHTDWQACVDAINSPAYVLDACWFMQAANAPLRHLFNLSDDGDSAPNLLHFIFLSPLARPLLPDWQARARRSVAEFRADVAQYIHSPDVQRFIQQLQADSPDFAQCWSEQTVSAREGGRRHFTPPGQSLKIFEQLTFRLATQNHYKLVMLLPIAQEAP